MTSYNVSTALEAIPCLMSEVEEVTFTFEIAFSLSYAVFSAYFFDHITILFSFNL